MADAPLLVGAMLALMAVLATVAIYARRARIRRTGALVVMLAGLAVTYFGFTSLTSHCKPWRLAFEVSGPRNVIAAVTAEGEAIYLWLSSGGAPRCYALPWDRATAEQLQEAMRQAMRDGGAVRLEPRADPSPDGFGPQGEDESLEDREPQMFHPVPPQADPPKQPEQYVAPRWDT